MAVNNMQTLDRTGSGMNCLLAAALMWFAWMAAMPEAWAQSLQCGDRVGVTYAGDYANIRDSACGNVIGRIRAGNEGQIASSSCSRTCSIGGTSYTFWDVRPHGWIAQGTSTQRWLVPMPGQGYYPNVSTQGAYPIQVYIDANNIPGLPVRAGPGLGYPEITGRRNPGETGTAYAVWVNRNEQLVWWRIRWSNGDIGWSADAKIPYGVYLIKTGGYSSFTTVQLRLEASGAGGSVGIKVYTPDLDAAVPSNFTVYTPATLRYVYNDRIRLEAPQTAPNGVPFQRWLRNGSVYSNQRSIEFNITSNDTFTAVYAYPTNTISIQSSNPNSGVYITVYPNDNNGAGSGYTPFTRTYNQGTTVRLTAPATAGGNQFQEWQRNGVRVETRTTYEFQVNANDTLTAVYRVDTTPPNLSNCRVSPSSICAGRTTTISANVTDSESDVAAVWADVCGTRVDMSPAGGSIYQGTYQAPCSTSDRSCNVIIYARDRANNQASCNAGTLSISGDRNPPTGSTCINPTSVGAGGGTINLYANLEDACCGVDRAFARIYKNGSFEATVGLNAASGSTPCAHNYRGAYAIPANNTGSNINWEIEICGQDRAGNVACSNRYRLVQPPCIQVTPSGGANFHRSSNGTVNPPSFPYTITNAGTSEIQYRISTNQNWLNIAPTYGTLQGGRSVRIDLSVNNNAHNLSPGTYTATVTFRNTTTGCEENRTVTLTVEGRNNTGTGRTHNPYWGARVRVTLNDRNRPPIENHNLVAYSDGKIYLHNPGGCSNNCQYESITVDSATGSVTVHPEKAISIGDVSRIEVVNPDPERFPDIRTYGGVNKYIAKIRKRVNDEVRIVYDVVELGETAGCGNCGRRGYTALSYGIAYSAGTWHMQCVSQFGSVIELIAIPLAAIDVGQDQVDSLTENWFKEAGRTYSIPPHILYAIGAGENRWLQSGYEFLQGGCSGNCHGWSTVRLSQLTYDGGIGAMQITGGTVWDIAPTPPSNFAGRDRRDLNILSDRLGHIWDLAWSKEYNIRMSAAVLDMKTRSNIRRIGPGLDSRQRNEQRDWYRRVLEHWYYAVWAYRGWPNPNDRHWERIHRDRDPQCQADTQCMGNGKVTYPQVVWGLIKGGSGCRVSRPGGSLCGTSLNWSLPWTAVNVTDAPVGDTDDSFWIDTSRTQSCQSPPQHDIPTPLPAHVDVDFDGVIDFKIHGPGSLQGGDLCSAPPSSDPYGRLSLVCSQDCPQERNKMTICGWIEKNPSSNSPLPNRIVVERVSNNETLGGGDIQHCDNSNRYIFRVCIPRISGSMIVRIKFEFETDHQVDVINIIHHAIKIVGSRLMTRAIRGRLELQNYEGEMPHIVTFVLRDPSTGEIVAEHDTYLDAEGNFDVPAPVGQLELSVKVSYWLRRAVLVDTTLGDVEGLVLSLINGDANDDNVVDGEDLAMVVQNYGSSCWDDCPEGGLPGDLNGDLVVDDNDLLIVLFNFGQQGD